MLISNNASPQKTGERLENGHRVWRRAHASGHVQRHGSYEERVVLELCASFRQSFQVEHFPFVGVDVSNQTDT